LVKLATRRFLNKHPSYWRDRSRIYYAANREAIAARRSAAKKLKRALDPE
jgi:hypothetical protein